MTGLLPLCCVLWQGDVRLYYDIFMSQKEVAYVVAVMSVCLDVPLENRTGNSFGDMCNFL